MNGIISSTGLPSSDVIRFVLPDNETVTFRPSGIEPKLKAYIYIL